MKKTLLAVLPLTLLLVSGCETSNSSTSIRKERYLQQQLARSQESSKNYERQIEKMSMKIDALQDEYAGLVSTINAVNKNMSTLSQQNIQLDSKITDLRKQLSAEQQARQTAINNMIDLVSKKTASAINAANKAAQTRNTSSSSSKKGPVGGGDYSEHKVEAGHTLSAIAAAYKVKVSDIRKANKLKNDMIRIGQILYIPKK
jgi:LysM repeat protein